MKNRVVIIFVLFAFFSFTAKPQQLANYELAKKFEVFDLAGELSRNSLSIYPNQINGTDNFWFEFKTSAGIDYYYVTPANGKKVPLFDKDKLAMGLTELTHETINPNDFSFYELTFSIDQKVVYFDYNGDYYEYNRLTHEVKKSIKVEEKKDEGPIYSWMNFSPDKRYILFAKNHNLYIKGNEAMGMDPKEVQLTFDGHAGCTYARRTDANAKDVEVPCRASWCKDSKHAYILREDKSKQRDFWVINSIAKIPELITYKYEYPGDKYVTQYDLLVIDAEKKTIKMADTKKWPDQDITVFETSTDGKFIYFERTKRTCDEVDVCSVNTSTLAVKEIIHEVDKPYRDQHARNVTIINNGKDILFRSERTGWAHYYHYDGDGNLKNTITSGNWSCGHIIAVDTLKRDIYFYGYGSEEGVNPFYYRVYKANIDREGATLITKENAQHEAQFLKSNRYFIDSYSRVDMEPKFILKNNKGKVICELAKPDLKEVYNTGWKMPEQFVVKAADRSTNLYGVMWKPADFDPNKKYPIISVVYPGPYFGFVPTSFTLSDKYSLRLAQLGFIVIAVGHRGDSPMRGKAYHRFGYGNMRDYPLEDDKFVIEQLADRYAYIDINKVGIYGHSGGGFMAAAAILTYPDFYKAAVSCSGNHDNNIYNRGWGELYNGVTEEVKIVKDSIGNEKKEYKHKFRVGTNMELAKNLKGNILLITGDMDTNVNPAHTYRLANAFIKANKDFDMLVVPGAGHGYGSSDKYVELKMFRFFAKHLLGDNRADGWYDMKRVK